jgi:hypothetical protein
MVKLQTVVQQSLVRIKPLPRNQQTLQIPWWVAWKDTVPRAGAYTKYF